MCRTQKKKVNICHAEQTRNIYFRTALSPSALFREFGTNNEAEMMYFDSMHRGFEEKIMELPSYCLLNSVGLHLREPYCF